MTATGQPCDGASPWRVARLVAGTLAAGLVFNAAALKDWTSEQVGGWQRDVGLGVLVPVAAASDALNAGVLRDGAERSAGVLREPLFSPDSSSYSVAVVGDSLAEGLGPALRLEVGRLSGASVAVEAYPGTTWGGVLFDWKQRLGELGENHDVVVISLAPSPSSAALYTSSAAGEQQWQQWWNAEVKDMTATVLRGGAQVVLLRRPVATDEFAELGRVAINAGLDAAAGQGVHIAELDEMVGSATATEVRIFSVTDRWGKTVRARDGVHYTAYGYQALARDVVADNVVVLTGVEAKS